MYSHHRPASAHRSLLIMDSPTGRGACSIWFVTATTAALAATRAVHGTIPMVSLDFFNVACAMQLTDLTTTEDDQKYGHSTQSNHGCCWEHFCVMQEICGGCWSKVQSEMLNLKFEGD